MAGRRRRSAGQLPLTGTLEASRPVSEAQRPQLQGDRLSEHPHALSSDPHNELGVNQQHYGLSFTQEETMHERC